MCDTQRSRRCVPHAATQDTSLNEAQGECALTSGNTTRRILRRNSFHRQRNQRLPQQTNECSIPTVCGETTTLCLNSHRASMLHSPTQPLPRGLVGNGTNEPPEPLRRINYKHAKHTQRRAATKPCFDSLQPWYQGQFKTPLQSRLTAGNRVIPKLHAGAMGV